MKITIETTVNAPVDAAWRAWTTPDDIVQWNAATDEWHAPNATIDLQVGGSFNYRMEAKDRSMGFDFTGRFTNVVENGSLAAASRNASRATSSDTPSIS